MVTYANLSGTPVMPIGHANRIGLPILGGFSSFNANNANNAYHAFIGQISWADSGSHTVDTTVSSALGWMSASSTLAVGTTLRVGLAAVDSTVSPAQPVTVANSITFDVYKDYTSAGAPTANAWNTTVPTSGTKTIAHMDLVAFCIQYRATSGFNLSQVQVAQFPYTLYGDAQYTSYDGVNPPSNIAYQPNCLIVASDGTLGTLIGSFVGTVGLTNKTWNNGSSPNEYGNYFSALSLPIRVAGIIIGVNISGINANCDLIFYTDPLGTPVAQKTYSVDADTVRAVSNDIGLRYFFPVPYDLAAGTDFAVVAKPTTANNITMGYKTFNALSHQPTEGLDGYMISRSGGAGAFAQQNSGKDRCTLGILLSGSGDGTCPPTSGGGSGGYA